MSRRNSRNVKKADVQHVKPLASNDLPPLNHQQASKQEAQLDSLLDKLREELGIPAGKKSLKALGKLPENPSTYGRIDCDIISESTELVGTIPSPSTNSMAVVGSCSGPGIYFNRFGTPHAVPWSPSSIPSSTSSIPQSRPQRNPQQNAVRPKTVTQGKRRTLRDISGAGSVASSSSCSVRDDLPKAVETVTVTDVSNPRPGSETPVRNSPRPSNEKHNICRKTSVGTGMQSPSGVSISQSEKSAIAPETRLKSPLQSSGNIPSVNLNRPSILSNKHSDLSYDLNTNQWEKAWGCRTDAQQWFEDSSSSESSMFSTRSSRSSKTSVASDEPGPLPTVTKYPPPPRYPEVCIRWLQDRCDRGHTCLYVHNDLEYEKPPASMSTTKPPAISYMFTIRDHIKIRCGPGFDIQEVVTGFESPWLHISKLPHELKWDQVSQYLVQRGCPAQEVIMVGHTAKVRFASHIDARNANASLNGSVHWGVTLTTRIALNNSSGRDIALQDTDVRLRWQAPGLVAYAGYRDFQQASKAMEIANTEYRTNFVSAHLHRGLPAVDRFTVRFQNLPIDTKKEDMEKYATPSDVVWDDAKYLSVDSAVSGIKRLLGYSGIPFLTFEVLPPPYREGLVSAWVQFATPALARDAVVNLHNRKPKCTGRALLVAQHLQSLEYAVPLDEFEKIASDVFNLRHSLVDKPLLTITTVKTPNSMRVRLSATDIKELGQLKADFERIRGGEPLQKDREIIWDPFFGSENGRRYLREVELKYPGVIIKEDIRRRRLVLFGPLGRRFAVRMLLLRRYDQLCDMEQRISLPKNILGVFINFELPSLRRTIGEGIVRLDLRQSEVIVRGTKKDLMVVRQAVSRASRRQSGYRVGSIASCPVCFSNADAPVSLKCGHTYCRACLINYLTSATENRFFPLTCLGKDATCGERIPLSVPREILPISDFDNLVDAAFQAYIHTKLKEFHYCPTPDCMQVYRSAPKGTVIQCPSCLLRICPECHVEYHDGFDCPERNVDQGFKQWVDTHDVKNCPGCNIPIERAEGCNHVTCTQCQSHICWVCMQLFPKGEGIYTHMRVAHGGIGLGPEDFIWEPFMQ